MQDQFHALSTLKSIDEPQIAQLRELGIQNLGDLLAYQPFRHARMVRAVRDNLLRPQDIASYLDETVRAKSAQEILVLPVRAIKGVGQQLAAGLKRLGLETVADLASYPPFSEAEDIVACLPPNDDRDPFAPPCVLPSCKKFTRNSKSYVSFFRQQELRGLSVQSGGQSLIAGLFRFSAGESKVVYLGNSVSYSQDWIFCGVHLGEPQGSVNLFMGQDTQVSIIDWRRAVSALRAEDTRASERLGSTLFHQRAVDEVARATAEEHQHGATSAFGANAATAGSFVAAGAVIGGVGGGISGSLVGLSVDVLTGGSTAGLGTLSGAVAGTAIGSIAGAAAGSLIFSGATTLGFVETDAEGDREVFARSAQNIQQRTVQNSSSIRSFWSNVVSQTVEEEQQRLRTDRVTNHNRIHALNALYFEVLNEYRLNISATDFSSILFLPFKPIEFNQDVLSRYWWLIRAALKDRALVLALDQHFLALSIGDDQITDLAALPASADVKASHIGVALNLDGSAMETAFKAALIAVFGSDPRIFPISIAAMLNLFYEAFKRDQIDVSLVTSGSSVRLTRQNSPNTDKNFIGRFQTNEPVALSDIRQIRVHNNNAEFSFRIGQKSIDVNELAFEAVTADLTLRDKATLKQALPSIDSLEPSRQVSGKFKVSAGRSKDVDWDIAARLNSVFEGVSFERQALQDEISSEALTAAKIANLLSFMNANRFGFTRLLLQSIEREQVIAALEDVQLGGLDLSAIAGTTPLGFCGNHVVLPLKKHALAATSFAAVSLDTGRLETALVDFEEIDISKQKNLPDDLKQLQAALTQLLQAAAARGNLNERDRQLVDMVSKLKEGIDRLSADAAALTRGTAGRLTSIPSPSGLRDLANKAMRVVRQLLVFLRAQVQVQQDDLARLLASYEDTSKALAGQMGQIIASTEVSLPSPAVFMEPVLSNAKGAELYDMRRNSHYDILPAPDIAAADPNVLRSRDLSLSPTQPAATLSIQNAPEFALPNSIGTALAEAGKLNLSQLITSNAGSLNAMLSNLSAVATELAKASATLTGDAQQQALASAGDVAKQVGDLLGKAIQIPATPAPAPTAPPPRTPQEKAETIAQIDKIDKSDDPPPRKKEKKQALGISPAPDDSRDYQMSILFLDEDDKPYPQGEFTLSLTFFELRQEFPINNGAPIAMQNGQFLFPDIFTLKKGRKATIHIDARFGSVHIPGVQDFVLPDSRDIVFKCRMLKAPPVKVSSTSVKGAVDTVVQSSSFSASIAPLLGDFLNLGIELPFKIVKLTGNAGVKPELNLRAEYNSGGTTTTTTSPGSTTVVDFEVVIPKLGWAIEVL